MKNRVNLSILLIAGLLLLAACGGLIDGQANGASTITINLGGRAAAEWPPAPDMLARITYVVKFSTSLKAQTIQAKHGDTININVVPGRWTVNVKAYLDGDLYAEDSVTQNIVPGANTVAIHLKRVVSDNVSDDMPDDIPGDNSVTRSVTVSPSSALVAPGASRQFTVAVKGLTDPSVIWTVSGGNGLTDIDADGLLAVDDSETIGTELTVTAESVEDSTLTGSAAVTITDAILSGISAVYSNTITTIYTSTQLNNLKTYLTVTAHYSNRPDTTLSAGDYTLSGALTVGTSEITVDYSGESTTFDVTVTAVTVSSITAVYNNPSTPIYPITPVDNLKTYLTVTAYYSDSTSGGVSAANYTLSGTLTGGTNTITVTYGGKTTTFNVTVVPPPNTWTAATNSTFTAKISSIAFGNNMFVAGGTSRRMAYSSDTGTTWTNPGTISAFGVGEEVSSIAFGGGRFVAGGSTGSIAHSTNGTTWTSASIPFLGIFSIAYGGNMFVAGFTNIAWSTDGTSWTTVGDSTFGGEIIYGIAYSGNTFVAVGNGGKIAWSADGKTWTAASSPLGAVNFRGIAWGGGKFVAVDNLGKMAWSTDGKAWTVVGDSQFGSTAIYSIAYGSGAFVAVGAAGKMAYSFDGINWTTITNPFGSTDINGIAYGGGKFVAVSGNGTIAYSNKMD